MWTPSPPRSVGAPLLLILALLCLGAGDCDCDGGRPQGLVGRWQVIEDRGGTQLKLMEFRPDGSCMGFNANSQGALLTYSLDTTKSPWWLDLRGPSNFWNPCILRLRSADELELGCAGPSPSKGGSFGQPAEPPVRPTGFEAARQPLVLRRMRP